MNRKFIPNKDCDFSVMANAFAKTIAEDPKKFDVSEDESNELTRAVEAFQEAYQRCASASTRSQVLVHVKRQARSEAEQMIRRVANRIRADHTIGMIEKNRLRLFERAQPSQPMKCPLEAPRLKFVRALHEGDRSTPIHELSFHAKDLNSGTRPMGATRLELFVDLVQPDAPVPAHPGANLGGRPWYLRSFTRSPIRIIPPVARVPMRVVYWARWADSTGDTGPFSATAVGWIEGGAYLPKQTPKIGNYQRNQVVEVEVGSENVEHERAYIVAVLDAQYESINQPIINHRLPELERAEQKQLEGPAVTEAA